VHGAGLLSTKSIVAVVPPAKLLRAIV